MKNSLPKFILINTATEPDQALEQITLASKSGAPWVQLRLKKTPKPQILETASAALQARGPNTLLCLNDHPDLALAAKIPSLHLGKNDLHPMIARNMLGSKCIIGCTVNSVEDANRLAKYLDVIDYFGVGPWRYTSTKENLAPILSPEDYAQIVQILSPKPCYAIGSITPEDLEQVQKLGLYGVALASDVFAHQSPQSRISVWKQLLDTPQED